MEQAVFNVAAEFNGKIFSGGEKPFKVRFPSDQEWIERSKKQRLVKKTLGRGRSKYDDPDNGELDLALLNKILLPGSGTTEFDGPEATKIIGKLERADFLEQARSGDSFEVKVGVINGIETAHRLRMPTQQQVMDYQRGSIQLYEVNYKGNRSSDIRTNLEPSGLLYDALFIDADGYVGAIPIVHKSVAVAEAINALEALEEAQDF